jgi:transcriptional regulator with XRE-family HTH domain
MMMPVAERPNTQLAHRDTQFLEETGLHAFPSSKGITILDAGERTGGGFVYLDTTPEEPQHLMWAITKDRIRMTKQARIFFSSAAPDYFEVGPDDDESFTFSDFAPPVRLAMGTTYTLGVPRAAIPSAWPRHHFAGLVIEPMVAPAPAPVVEADTTVAIDIPAALQNARSQAGLPVQDLAAMLGIKRRQFYNLMSGQDTPDPSRERRIARIADAVRRISDAVDENSRNVRTLLLARLDGDSVYDAAVADDNIRFDAATERAIAAATGGETVPSRSAPSTRATPKEAAAVREFLRATRDDTGNDLPDA